MREETAYRVHLEKVGIQSESVSGEVARIVTLPVPTSAMNLA